MGGPCPATPPSTDRTGEVLIALGTISRQPLRTVSARLVVAMHKLWLLGKTRSQRRLCRRSTDPAAVTSLNIPHVHVSLGRSVARNECRQAMGWEKILAYKLAYNSGTAHFR